MYSLSYVRNDKLVTSKWETEQEANLEWKRARRRKGVQKQSKVLMRLSEDEVEPEHVVDVVDEVVDVEPVEPVDDEVVDEQEVEVVEQGQEEPQPPDGSGDDNVPVLLRISSAARFVGVRYQQVYQAATSGRIRLYISPDDQTKLVFRDDLVDWIERRRVYMKRKAEIAANSAR